MRQKHGGLPPPPRRAHRAGDSPLIPRSPASRRAACPAAEAEPVAASLEIHHTPKHGTWRNVAEIEPAVLQRRCLRRRLADRTAMAGETAAWAARRNTAAAAIRWQFATAGAPTKPRRFSLTFEP